MEPTMGGLYGLGICDESDLARTERCMLPELKVDNQRRFFALHNEFVASAKAVIEGHKINPDFMIGNMICHITWYPLTPNPKDMLEFQRRDEICNDLCGDVQVRGEYPYFARKYFEEFGVGRRKEPVPQSFRLGLADRSGRPPLHIESPSEPLPENSAHGRRERLRRIR